MFSKRTRLTLAATTALPALLVACPVLADEAAQHSGQIEEITVTAQKRAQNLQDVPISIGALDSQAIKDLGIKSSDEIGEFMSNLEIGLPSGKGNQPIVSIRGVGANDSNTNNAGPNGIYVDEVYMASPSGQTFQTFDLDRVEVLKGPQGTLYGRNTTGGAVNYITVKPSDETEGYLHTSYGTYNTYQVDGAVGGQIADKLDGRLSLVRNYSDGYMRNELTDKPASGANDWAGRGQLLYKPNADLNLLLNVHGGQVDVVPTEYHQLGTLSAGIGSPSCANAQILAGGCGDAYGFQAPSSLYKGEYARDQKLKVNSVGASLRADYTLGDITLTSLTSYENLNKIHPEDTIPDPFDLLTIDYGVKSEDLSQEFRAAGGGERYHWLGGVYLSHEDLVQDQNVRLLNGADAVLGAVGAGATVGALQANVHSYQRSESVAAFGQSDYEILDRLQLTLGGRYTLERRSFASAAIIDGEAADGTYPASPPFYAVDESLTNAHLNWHVALDYHLTDQALLYTSVSTGFKSGGFNGGFLSTDPATAQIQLAPIKPETVTAYEVGFKSDLLDKRLRLNGAAFYYEYTNMQTYAVIDSGAVPVSVLTNAPKATIEGLELSADAKPLRDLTTHFNLGYVYTRLGTFDGVDGIQAIDYTNHRLPLSPRFTFDAIVDYAINLPNDDVIKAQGSASWRSLQYFDMTNSPILAQQDYWLVNARLSYLAASGKWEVAAYGKNLSGSKYYNYMTNLSSLGVIEGVVGAPISGGVEATYHF